MNIDRKLIEKLLFETKISNSKIAKASGIKDVIIIKKIRDAEYDIDNIKLVNAEAMMLFAQKVFYPEQ